MVHEVLYDRSEQQKDPQSPPTELRNGHVKLFVHSSNRTSIEPERLTRRLLQRSLTRYVSYSICPLQDVSVTGVNTVLDFFHKWPPVLTSPDQTLTASWSPVSISGLLSPAQ
ncbi:hypothetical protein BaRGS_00004882 [Batillaria attramentaria]|uniref:Uncharacterized protein n=1 Tax=Batillaria attramentaria TaxID=370345 RepID=A0ABD0LW00_9CAEN